MTRNLFAQMEIGLHRLRADAYEVELRVTDPATEAEISPVRGPVRIDFAKLVELHLRPDDYGQALADQIFQDPAVREHYLRNKTSVDTQGTMLRLRITIGPSAPELHGLRWELLRDPETKAPFATSERVMFSRFMLSRDWRVVKLRPKARLKALIAISAPGDVTTWGLAAVDGAGEAERASVSLAGMQTTTLGVDQPLTLEALAAGIRQGVDVLYLVCHGAMPKESEPCLYLQTAEGKTSPVVVSALTQRIAEMREVPRLVVLASCESAGRSDDPVSAQAALAPRLAEAGIPAVLAMQGKISMETVKLAMPVFFSELLKDGQIDRALAVARGVVRGRSDSWMPALFLRLKSGRIWYEPGFGGEGKQEFEKWKAICAQVNKGEFIPIVGPELGETVFGGTSELASSLAEAHAFPLATHERTDLAKVTQYISTNQNRKYAREAVENGFLRQLSSRLEAGKGEAKKTLGELLQVACEKSLADPENPYTNLAKLPASIYLNASYEPLLFRSLKASGRTPEALMCSWRGEGVPQQPQPKTVTPTAEAPWVYHVFGLYGRPDTMVLTEDDFFDYLIATSRLDLLMPKLVGRLMQCSLLFLGFRLDDWRFRVLFRMIVTRQGTETMKLLSHVGVQVNPDEQSMADVERARKYMESYFQGGSDAPEISIYWGSAADFLKELNQHRLEMPEETVAVTQGADDDWL